MFDLNDSIRDWRFAFSQHEGCSAEDVQELESHLREEMAALQKGGLSEREAFTVGVLRLGRADDVCGEYAKANPGPLWENRIYWMAVGVLLWLLLPASHGALFMLAAGMTVALGVSDPGILGTTLVAIKLLSWSAFVWCAWVCYSRGLPRLVLAKLTALTATRTRTFACLMALATAKVSSMFWFAPVVHALRTRGLDAAAMDALYPSTELGVVLSVASRMTIPAVLILFVVSQAGRRGGPVPATH